MERIGSGIFILLLWYMGRKRTRKGVSQERERKEQLEPHKRQFHRKRRGKIQEAI
jgi:hypothetical protein